MVLSRDGSFEPNGRGGLRRLRRGPVDRPRAGGRGRRGGGLRDRRRGPVRAALPKAKRLYLTEVEAEVEGDARFPDFDEADWREVRREEYPAGEDDDYPFVFRVLER